MEDRTYTKFEKYKMISFNVIEVLSKKIVDFKNEITWKSLVNDVADVLIKAGYDENVAYHNAKYLSSWAVYKVQTYMHIHYLNARNIPSLENSLAFKLDSGVSTGMLARDGVTIIQAIEEAI